MNEQVLKPVGSPIVGPKTESTVAQEPSSAVEISLAATFSSGPSDTRRSRSVTVIDGATQEAEDRTVKSNEEAAYEDTRDDSEAETVLSSPVKRREELHRSKGLGSALANASSAASHEKDPGRHNDYEHSTSSSGSEISQMRQKDTDLQSISSNPRKRKHRASSFGGQAATLDLAKRQRRASENKGVHAIKQSTRIPPDPRSRRDDRSSSAVPAKAGDTDTHSSASCAGRPRRPGAPARESKTSQQQWDTDSEPEEEVEGEEEDEDDDSKAPPQSRNNIRNLNRATSTPGRPLGRDHKRHVNKYGFTRLAEACESGDLDMVKEWREKDPEQLELPEFAGNTPLQVASLNGYPEVVEYLLREGCNAHCANTDKDTPLIDAVENSHTAVVELLLNAGVDPLRQNRKGQQALDVITDETEDGEAIRTLLRNAIENRKESGRGEQERDEKDNSTIPGPRQGLHFMARTPDNLLTLVSSMDREGVKQFLDAHVPVDNNIVAAAAGTGDAYLVNMLLAEMSPKKRRSRPERLMLKVLGTSHFDMVKFLTELEYFNALWRSKPDGLTWFELAEKKGGPFWREEKALLIELFQEANANSRLSSSPVSKKEGTHRRQRSPLPTIDDIVEEEASVDLARAKRRLVSRKNMRPSGARDSPPARETPPTPSSPEAAAKLSEGEVAASASHASGWPRTKSTLINSNNGPSDNRAKRIKPGVGEKLALFESAAPDKKRRADDQSQSRPASELVVKRRESIAANADGAATEVVDARSDESPTVVIDDKTQEEVAGLTHSEKAEAQRQRLQLRLEKLERLPKALYSVLAGTFRNNECNAAFTKHWFLPLVVLSLLPPGDGRDETDKREDQWLSNYQAAGILQGSVADLLLDMGSDADEAMVTRVANLRRRDMTTEERMRLRRAIGLQRLAAMQFGKSVDKDATSEEISASGIEDVRMIHDAKEAYNDMSPLYWINLADVLALEAWLRRERAEGGYQHLALIRPDGEEEGKRDELPTRLLHDGIPQEPVWKWERLKVVYQ